MDEARAGHQQTRLSRFLCRIGLHFIRNVTASGRQQFYTSSGHWAGEVPWCEGTCACGKELRDEDWGSR